MELFSLGITLFRFSTDSLFAAPRLSCTFFSKEYTLTHQSTSFFLLSSEETNELSAGFAKEFHAVFSSCVGEVYQNDFSESRLSSNSGKTRAHLSSIYSALESRPVFNFGTNFVGEIDSSVA